MNEIDKKIKYQEDLIENIKIALDIALQQTNNINLEDKEMSFVIYCNDSDRLVCTSKSDIGLKFAFEYKK